MPFLTYKNSEIKIKKSISIEPTLDIGNQRKAEKPGLQKHKFIHNFPRAQLLVSANERGTCNRQPIQWLPCHTVVFQKHVSELFNTQENVVYTGVSVITENT